MSFLIESNDDFIKLQLRKILVDPNKKKELKKKLKKLGLYNPRNGFCTYRDFFHTELGRVSRTPRSQRVGSLESAPFTSKRPLIKKSLPSLSHHKITKTNGIVNTLFFKKGKVSVGCCVLFTLVNKIFILPEIDVPPIKMKAKYENEFELRFIPVYIGTFFSICENLNKIIVGNQMNYSSDVKKSISNAYIGICSVYGVNRKVYLRNKDTRIVMFLSAKTWPAIIAEALNKFFFKKHPLLNEQTFEEFVGNYILTHNSLNQKRLCFELYDRAGLQYITSKQVFNFFESPIFPLIKSDLFTMINYLSNDRYAEETEKLRRTNTRIIESEVFKTIETEPKKMTFKAFSKLKFEQKFPDMLLAIVYSLFEDIGVNFLTNYFSIPKYKVTMHSNSAINVIRPINLCKDYLKIVKSYYQMIRNDIKKYKPKSENFTPEMIKGAAVSFMLGCHVEYLCQYRNLGATVTSLTEGSLLILGKRCPLIMDRLFRHIAYPGALKITIWEFVEYLEGFFSEEEKFQRCFDMYDTNGDGLVSNLEMVKTLGSGEFLLSPALEEEIKKLAEIMENKRFSTVLNGGFIDFAGFQSTIVNPAFPYFLKERLIFNAKNMNSLYQKRYDQLMEDV